MPAEGEHLFSVELGPHSFLSSWVFQGEVLCYDPMDHSLPGSYVHADSPGKNTGVGSHSLLQGNLPNPVIKPGSPALQADSLLAELPGKPT